MAFHEDSSSAHQPAAVSRVADLSEGGFMGFGGTADGSNPWSIYGIAFKKYVIEVLDGEKIVSRKKGFTVDTCTAAISAEDEGMQGPQFQGVPVGQKMRMAAADRTVCRKVEGPDLKGVCAVSCEASCSATVDAYVAESARETGIAVDALVRDRVLKSCVRDCRSDCAKPGKVFDFVVTSRR
ncbi:hypothetical protein FOA52_009330 [Chlamydomonas sp. UWO 241]|nr:hypothetical protein FOA52_009330 [Chlamydomonas sp. UWO 241]